MAPSALRSRAADRAGVPSRRLAGCAPMPVALAVWLVAAGVAGGPPAAAASGGLTLASPAFEAGSGIPRRHTCEGEDVSPPLRWSHVPEDARSLVLVVDDPDAPDPAAPRRTWVHWLLYDLPPDATGLPEDVARADLPPGTKQGRNDWKRTGYGGPCPPIGRHRYFFKLYALDRKLGDLEEPTGAELERAMQGRILQRAELVGTYQKQR